MRHVLKHGIFDGHVHFRRGPMLKAVAPLTARQCWGAIVMPNCIPFITTPEHAIAYRDEILEATGPGFTPYIVGYLTPDTRPEEIRRGFHTRAWYAMKVYPRAAHGHGTTNASDGINMWQLPDHPALAVMEEIGMPLLVHPEINTTLEGILIDIYDREAVCVPILLEIRKRYPRLKLVAEHGTSVELAACMEEHGDPEFFCCTVTAHHPMFDRNDLHTNGFQPHLMCYPILKRRQARDAWRKLMTSGAPFVFAGTDSAPHPTHAKENACGCAGGVMTAHAMAPMYAQVFHEMGALAHLEAFLCINGPRFYGLSPRQATVVLETNPWTCDSMIAVDGGTEQVRPFGYHEEPDKRYTFPWRISECRART